MAVDSTAATVTRGSRVAALLLAGAALLFYVPYLGWLPRGIHEWAQADRLALALSFYDFGFDLWHPRTFSVQSADGVTGVEFPLYSYLASLLGIVFGREGISPAFRLLTLATAAAGCYCAFRLVYDLTGKFALSLLPAAFLLSSPAFVYYSGNYLPDAAGASLVLVGIYVLVRAVRAQPAGVRGMILGILVLTVATLVKLSAGLYLGGAVVGLGLYLLQHRLRYGARHWLALAASALGSGACIIGYLLYTRYLNAAYNSTLFLAAPRPIDSPATAAFIWARIQQVWWPEYFSLPASLVLGAAVGLLAWKSRRGGWRRYHPLVGAAMTVVVGGLAFFALMGKQFIDHDYYALAPYAPLLTLVVAGAAYVADRQQWQWSGVAAGVGVVVLLAIGWHRHTQRMQEPYGNFSNYYSYHWMVNADAALARARVPARAQVLVLGEDAPNLALVYLNRRGITWKSDLATVTETELLNRMQQKKLHYLILSQRNMRVFGPAHPDLLRTFRLVYATPNFVVYQPRTLPAPW
ncbi:glycosyltransferase family protein [Hymenobacter weizhouensis]|uniref:hypothetical protein n=1 Tax=Hymenobacter sp. YIM 151500-1 TaxID=2987689 RepID=UPI002225D187|nr:hypothetical protein [Hymenobacter sp. YIM 151500-1]UYZ62081.1 hypothetical protein OIS53_13830 [Hymenobacter sp. YIM 151500-1]